MAHGPASPYPHENSMGKGQQGSGVTRWRFLASNRGINQYPGNAQNQELESRLVLRKIERSADAS